MTAPLKILHIDTEHGFRGGEQQVLWLAEGLGRQGIVQGAAVRRGSLLGARLREIPVTVHELRQHQAWRLRTVAGLRKLAREGGYSLVHAHTANGHTLAWRAFRGRLPIVVTRRVDFAIKSNPLSKHKYLDDGIQFIAISNGVRDVLIGGGVDEARINVVRSGVDTERFLSHTKGAELRHRWGVKEPGPLIGVVGAYVDHKDPLNLIGALPMVFERLPEARAVFVGEGELRAAMQEAVAAHGLQERVHLTGWRDDVGDCLAAFDLFVMPSKLEGLCTSLLDAQAVGVPCIGTKTGGIPDIIADGENGLLVPAGDSDALGEAIVRLWEDRALRDEFAGQGPCVVKEKFRKEAMVEGTLAVYRELTESAGSRQSG